MSAPNLNDSLAQAHALHEQLAPTAHGLRYACEDIALVLVAPLPPGALEPPGGGPALVERWRRAGDLALQVARAWEGVDLPDVRPSQPTPGKDEAAHVCDTAVRDLFRVTMSLSNLERSADEPLRSMIGTLVEELDLRHRRRTKERRGSRPTAAQVRHGREGGCAHLPSAVSSTRWRGPGRSTLSARLVAE